jgi:hypothetical protein
MTGINDSLQEKRNLVARKRHLESLLSNLKNQRGALEKTVWDLERIMNNEQIDVDNLEGLSLTAILYSIIGKRDEKLSKEREEAYTAKIKYDLGAGELRDINNQIEEVEKELATLSGCENDYVLLLNEKKSALIHLGGDKVDKILAIEDKIAQLNNQQREIREAIEQGNAAKDVAREAISCLNKAESWSSWDILGGGIVADIAKHNAINEAEEKVKKLQITMRRFKTELVDITIEDNLNVGVDGFGQFADFFFDGFISDISVLNHIEQSVGKIKKVKADIVEAVKKLEQMQVKNDDEITRLKWNLGQIIVDA